MALILGGSFVADFEHEHDGTPVSQVVQDPLDAGREALRRRDWAEGYDLLQAADESGRARARGPAAPGRGRHVDRAAWRS